MKQLMLGNEAVARGLYEAGCRVVSSYPGTPSTEITECAAKYEEIYAEWAPNEKVAAEVAIGAAIGGARSFCGMKHVGLNVAADPVFTASYTGVNGGMLIGVADDPGMHSSQNEQDSRHYAIAAKLPMLEPSDSQECKDFAALGLALSEQFDTPVFLRMTTRVAHSQSLVSLCPRDEVGVKDYHKNPAKNVMMPAMAKGRHAVVEERTQKLVQWAETSPLSREEMFSTEIGIITSGINYQYCREAMGENASYLKLGMVNPLPVERIQNFAAKVKTLYVVEDLDDVIETHCKKIGVACVGKDVFSLLGEFSQKTIREKLLRQEPDSFTYPEPIPVRPPVMCAGCPHRGLFYVLNKLKLVVCGDIGCYTLGAAAPLNAIDMCVCMGASISGLHGFQKARGEEVAEKSVAVIGDSTFMHSGMTGLANIVYNKGISTVIILDNSITGMTGHQQNPTTGLTLKGEETPMISLEKVCEGFGIGRVFSVDPNDIKEVERLIRQETAIKEPSVIITRRPCALLKKVKHHPPFHVEKDRCRSCKMCFKIGCPAIRMKDGKADVDTTLCVGCGLCLGLCPFDAIQK